MAPASTPGGSTIGAAILTYVYDLECRYCTYVAGSLFDDLGCTPDAIDFMSAHFLASLTHEEDRPRIAAHHDALRSMNDDAVAKIEYRIKTPSGHWRWLVSRDRPFLRDRNGRIVEILCMAELIAGHEDNHAS